MIRVLTRSVLALLCAATVVSGAGATVARAAELQAAEAGDLRVNTLPRLPGAVFLFDDVPFVADDVGTVRIPHAGDLKGISDRLLFVRFEGDPTTTASFSRFIGLGRANRTREVTGLFTTSQLVGFTFSNLSGAPVNPDRIERMTLKNSLGVLFELNTAELRNPVLLPSKRVVPRSHGPEVKEIYYTVQDVMIDGANTVNRSQQRFLPAETTNFEVETQFFDVDVVVSDALFGFSNGSAVLVRWPDGAETRHETVDGLARLPALPRGEYQMRVDGAGLRTWRPVSVSRDQLVELELLSVIDIAAATGAGLAVATSAIVVGRRRHRKHLVENDEEITRAESGLGSYLDLARPPCTRGEP